MSIASNWETSPLNHVEYGPLKTFNVDNKENCEMFTQALPAVAKDIFSTKQWGRVQSRVSHLQGHITGNTCVLQNKKINF